MNQMKKFLAVLLSAVMCLSLIPAVSFDAAQAETTVKILTEAEKAAKMSEMLDFSGRLKEMTTQHAVPYTKEAAETDPYVNARIIVKSAEELDYTGSVAYVNGYNDWHIIQYRTPEEAKKAAEMYETIDGVQYAEPDGIKSIAQEPGVNEFLSWGYAPEHVSAFNYNEWLLDYYGSMENVPEVIAAVIDTGCDSDHEYLEAQLLDNGYDFYNNDNDPEDDNGHGTHCAGTIIDGNLPNVRILPIKVLDWRGDGYDSQIILGMEWAYLQGADAANLSLRGPCYHGDTHEAFVEVITTGMAHGTVYCCAAGNETDDVANYCPANVPEAFTVAAHDAGRKLTIFSNFGEEVDITAPGRNIYSAQMGGGYVYNSGTSMATPHVTAACALVRSFAPDMSAQNVIDVVKGSAVDEGIEGGGAGLLCVTDLFKFDPYINGENSFIHFTSGDAYPWNADESYAFSSNAGIDNSESVLASTPTLGAYQAISFEYKVSSEENHDFFRFCANGETLLEVSGEQDWQTYTGIIPAIGEVKLTWGYIKDASGAAGEDKVWIRNVIVEETISSVINTGNNDFFFNNESDYPWVIDDETVKSGNAGINDTVSEIRTNENLIGGITFGFDYKVDAGEGDRFQFLVNGEVELEVNNATDWTEYQYTIPETGEYELTFRYIKDGNGSVGEDSVRVKNVDLYYIIDRVLNIEGGELEFDSTGNYPWEVREDYAKSSNGGVHNSTSGITLSLHMNAGETLIFDYMVSSESDYDELIFRVNDSQIFTRSGEGAWRTYAFTAETDGTYNFEWVYDKDEALNSFNDCACLDNVFVTQDYHDYTLDEALNVSGGELDFETFGDYLWMVDGDYAKSGNESAHNSTSGITLSVHMNAGETLIFDYMVSSESDYDELTFRVNDSQIFTRSGEVAWRTYAFTAETDGTYNFEWVYDKDRSVNIGNDCACLDNVFITQDYQYYTLDEALNVSGGELDFETFGDYPWMVDGDYAKSGNESAHNSTSGITLSLHMNAGETLVFDYMISSESNCDKLTFRANDSQIFTHSGEVAWRTYAFTAETDGTYNFEWIYDKDRSVNIGNDCACLDNVFITQDYQYYTLDEALNVSGGELDFETFGDYPWMVDGDYAKSSNEGVHNSTSGITLSLHMNAGETLVFDYMISSESNRDKLTFRVNDSQIFTCSGEVAWKTYAFTAETDGTYNFEWVYDKDRSINRGNDCACLDNVFVTQDYHDYTLDEALNVSDGELDFETFGDYPWMVNEDYAKSSNEGIHNSTSGITLSLHMNAGETLIFDYMVSSESDYDELTFRVNDSQIFTRSGEVAWRTYAFTAETDGTYNFEWVYDKHYNGNKGNDCACLDNVFITQDYHDYTLDEALNVSGGELDFETFSDYPWMVDGDYAKSGNSEARDTSSSLTLSINMNAGDMLTFDYKLSSKHTYYNEFLFYVNSRQNFIDSGEVSWTTYTFTAPVSGTYTFEWKYYKDESVSNGEDCAYLDNVFVTQASSCDTLESVLNIEGGELDFETSGNYLWEVCEDYAKSGNSEAHGTGSSLTLSINMNAGDMLTFDYKVSSESNYDKFLFYVNSRQNLIDSGEVSWNTYTFTVPVSGTYTFEWKYYKDESVSNGEDCAYLDNVFVTRDYYYTLDEALNMADGELDFETSSDYPWEVCDYYAKSGNFGVPGTSSSITLTIYMNVAETLCFDYKVSSESNNDTFAFYVNGREEFVASGEASWNTCTFTASVSGTYTFEWRYTKDEITNSGEDCVCIDNVAIQERLHYYTLNRALNIEGGDLEFETDYSWEVIGDYAKSCNEGNIYLYSSLTLSINMNAGDMLTFDYKVSSEPNYDEFFFYANGSRKLVASGEVSWTTYTFTAPSSGTYNFDWIYVKDAIFDSGYDCACLDNVFVTRNFLPGDSNGDGTVNIADALLVLRYSIGGISEINLEAADVNGDGLVNVADALAILRMAIGG